MVFCNFKMNQDSTYVFSFVMSICSQRSQITRGNVVGEKKGQTSQKTVGQ